MIKVHNSMLKLLVIAIILNITIAYQSMANMTDYYGVARDDLPDIGAIEFSSDPLPFEVAAPSNLRTDDSSN